MILSGSLPPNPPNQGICAVEICSNDYKQGPALKVIITSVVGSNFNGTGPLIWWIRRKGFGDDPFPEGSTMLPT